MNTLTISRQTVEIEQYIRQGGGRFSDWYVGIAADLRQRLFNDHNVTENYGHYIGREYNTSQEARAVEQYFLNLGCDGGAGGGGYNTKAVYAYKKTSQTRE